MFYDAENNKRVSQFPVGECGQISWRRLTEVLQQSGEITEKEKITHFRITDNFLIYRLDSR